MMATFQPVNRYVVRWNAALVRKELRSYGRNTIVVGGGMVEPGAPDVTLTVSPTSAAPSAAFTLTATATGGTSPYTYTFTKPGSVAALSGTGATRTGTVPAGATTNLTFGVTVTDALAKSQQATVVLAVTGSTPTGSLFAGHVPNRVLVGMATASGNPYAPSLATALTHIGSPGIYEGREFSSGVFTTATANSMADSFDNVGALPVVSWKPKTTTESWTDVYNGSGDSKLIEMYNWAVSRRTAGPGGGPLPALVGYHHEPSGDPQGTLAEWGEMQYYCSNFLAGRRGGTNTSPYVAAYDVSDVVAWATIGNGFWWLRPGTAGAAGSAASQAYPQKLIDALRINRHVLMNDFYDADYTDQAGALSNESLRTPLSTGVRTSSRIANFMTWARAKNTGAVGCGEYGVIDGAEMAACAAVMTENNDLWAISNYFNSSANSDHEWRIIPSSFPAGNPVNDKNLVDFGGNAQSQGRLDAFKTFRNNSASTPGPTDAYTDTYKSTY